MKAAIGLAGVFCWMGGCVALVHVGLNLQSPGLIAAGVVGAIILCLTVFTEVLE